MSGYGDKPFGLRQIRLTPWAGGTAIDLPISRVLKFKERVLTGTQRGWARTAHVVTISDVADFELEGGGISLEAYALMTGRKLTSNGITPAGQMTLTGAAEETFPYFSVQGRSLGEGADDIWVTLFKCKLTDGLEGVFQDGQFFMTATKGMAVDDGVHGVFDFVQQETASTLTPLQIEIWQNGGDPVYVSGQPSTEWNLTDSFPTDASTQTDPFTILERGHALRQTCLITSIEVNVYYLHPPGGATWEFKLFFWNGTEYECKASQAFTPAGSGVVNNIQSFRLSPPIAADEGDIPALYLPIKNATVMGTDASRNMPAPRYLNANVAVGEADAFSDEVAGGSRFVNILTKSNRPYVAWLGDSIVGSGNGVPASGEQWKSDQENVDEYHSPGGSPGNQLCDLPYQFSLLAPPTLQHQSIAKGGSKFSDLVAAGAQLDRLVLVDAAVVIIHCGVNDVAAARTWAAVEADLDTIRAALPTQTLYLDEILPFQGSDAQAATIRTWNANYATWCTANDVTLVKCHDEMAVIRSTTGRLDDLNPTYSNGDSVHLSQAGVQKLAELERRTVG